MSHARAPSYSRKSEDLSNTTSDLLIQPSPGLAQGSFWDAKVRDGLRSKKFKNAGLNERRRKVWLLVCLIPFPLTTASIMFPI